MKVRIEPFAVQLYKQHEAGKSVAELAQEFGIPADRVEIRIRAAEVHMRREATPLCDLLARDSVEV